MSVTPTTPGAAIRPMSRDDLATAMFCTNRSGKSCMQAPKVWVDGLPYCKRCAGRASKMIAGIVEWRAESTVGKQ